MPFGTGAGHVELAAIRVSGYIIESTITTDELNFEDSIGATLLRDGVDGEQKSSRDGGRYRWL